MAGRRGQRGARPGGHMFSVAYTAEVISHSEDGRRANTIFDEVITAPEPPAHFLEDHATNAARESANFSYDLGDTSWIPVPEEPSMDGIVMTGPRKHYENSDFPMNTWISKRDLYLDEWVQLEGRGDSAVFSNCGGCSEENPRFRCKHQACFGCGMLCQSCIVLRHQVLPTHWIEEWTGGFFVQRVLEELGLVIQLGHPAGISCPTAHAAHELFVLIDVTGIHKLKVKFCKCEACILPAQQLMRVRWWPATFKDPQTCTTFTAIRLFQLLNCQGKLTNNDGLHPLPDRRRAFQHIVRQYRMTLMMKRAGRAHDPTGVDGTAQGELALECRACPQDGKNVLDGWNKIDWEVMPEDLRYKYFLFLAQDCNFRLINRNVGKEGKDPIVGDGLGYFVNQEKYAAFLRDHVLEEEISSRSGFQAMFLANRKRIKGLHTTGVGGVTCVRHNMWRPNGIGDLQLGERFCNMDFILASAVLNAVIFYLILSYDIACQYGKNFWTRMQGLPAGFMIVLDILRVWFKVPNFHLPPHKPPCHSPYSFHWMWGAGRTHGETVEQNWEFTNGAAVSTKMMGVGTRHLTLEDLFGFHNWRRLVAWRGIFASRMAEDVKEGQVHHDTFEVFDAALRENDREMVEGWKGWVTDWESQQHTDNSESPFETAEKVMTMKEIRLKLVKKELIRSGEGVEVEREDTPSTFIIMGLEIEESQRHLAIDVKATPMDSQTIDFVKRRSALVKRLRAFCKLQRAYMPNVRRFLSQSQCALWDSEAERDAEAVRLFLPSDIADARKREKACAVGLPDVEADLREAEAHEALESLRQGLCARTMMNRFRLRNATGQRALTRGQGMLRQLNMKIHKAKLRYRFARNVLAHLREHGAWERDLQVLNDVDIRALNERALTEEERAQREAVHDLRDVEEGGIGAYGVVALGEGRRTLSWIWYVAKKGEPTEQELVEALWVEWCKAYACMRRWHEDVVLVEEEMRRTIEYGYWSTLDEGLRAYAGEQASRELETCEQLTKKWAAIRAKGRAYLAGETPSSGEVRVPIMDDEARGEDDEEEGPPDYEDEGDDEVLD
ncbi:hypothetical protein FB451DRAFT_1387723 [Mycena latifolia]|nr:hypothetical protein FB451DRAFT_1387723 [Mycena latifolia]